MSSSEPKNIRESFNQNLHALPPQISASVCTGAGGEQTPLWSLKPLDDGGVTLKTTPVPVRGPHVRGEMRNVCSIRMVAGCGGWNTEVGLGLSIDPSVADPVRG